MWCLQQFLSSANARRAGHSGVRAASEGMAAVNEPGRLTQATAGAWLTGCSGLVAPTTEPNRDKTGRLMLLHSLRWQIARQSRAQHCHIGMQLHADQWQAGAGHTCALDSKCGKHERDGVVPCTHGAGLPDHNAVGDHM